VEVAIGPTIHPQGLVPTSLCRTEHCAKCRGHGAPAELRYYWIYMLYQGMNDAKARSQRSCSRVGPRAQKKRQVVMLCPSPVFSPLLLRPVTHCFILLLLLCLASLPRSSVLAFLSTTAQSHHPQCRPRSLPKSLNLDFNLHLRNPTCDWRISLERPICRIAAVRRLKRGRGAAVRPPAQADPSPATGWKTRIRKDCHASSRQRDVE